MGQNDASGTQDAHLTRSLNNHLLSLTTKFKVVLARSNVTMLKPFPIEFIQLIKNKTHFA